MACHTMMTNPAIWWRGPRQLRDKSPVTIRDTLAMCLVQTEITTKINKQPNVKDNKYQPFSFLLISYLFYLFVLLSIYLCSCLSFCLPSTYLYFLQLVCVSIRLSICLYVSRSVRMYVYVRCMMCICAYENYEDIGTSNIYNKQFTITKTHATYKYTNV